MAQTYVPTNEQWADLVSRIKAVQVADQYGWNTAQAISRNKATSLLYQESDNQPGQWSKIKIKTQGNDDYSLLEGWGTVIGTQNALSLGANGKHVYSLINGFMNTVSSNSTDGVGTMVFGNSNKTTNANAIIYGGGNTLDGGKAFLVIGNNNTAYATKDDGTYEYTYQGDDRGNNGNSIVLGYSNFVYSNRGIMIGVQTMNYTDNDVMIGSRCFSGRNDVTGTEWGTTTAVDQCNVGIGKDACGYGIKNVMIGVDAAVGWLNRSGVANATNIQGSVAIGAHSKASRNREFAVGGWYYNSTSRAIDNFTRIVSGVSEGVLDTDAVNKKQLVDYVAENAPEPEVFTDAEWSAMWA